MRNSLSDLQDGCDLCVRSREKAGDLVSQRLVGGEPGKLALPEVEIAPGKLVEIACIVVFGGHDSL